jgi:Tol biopolymer transport system component
MSCLPPDSRVLSDGQSGPPHRSGRIAFDDSASGIYTMSFKGKNAKQLTSLPVRGSSPAYSPDGKKIVFHSFRTGNGEIFSMNSDGTGVTKLTLGSSPVFSPGGGRILFVGSRDGDSGMFMMRADGSGEVQLTHNTNSMSYSSPDWQPVE